MDLARALAADLRDLAVDLSAGGYTRTTLAMLDRNLRRSVVSTLGSTVTLVAAAPTGATISVNFVSRVVEPHEIAAALGSPSDRWFPGQRFDRLQLQRTRRLRAPRRRAGRSAGPGPARGRPAPDGAEHPRLAERNVEGLEDFSLLNRALGVLMNRGYSVDEARAELGLHAQRSHTAVTAAAQTLLASACY